MKKRWLAYLAWGIVGYLVFLVATVPAGWLAWGVGHFSRGVVSVERGQGSLWHGTGHLIVYHPQATPRDLGQAEWRVHLWSMLLARLRVSVNAVGPQSTFSATVTLSPREAALTNSRLSASARFASAFYAPAGLMAPTGQLRANTKELRLNREGLHGAAQLFWDGAGSDLSSVNPLGDYRLDVNGEGENVVFKLATVRGALEVTGQGHWQPLRDGMLQINGYARARAQQKELQPLLQLLGAEQGGRRLFQLRLQLPVRNFLPL